MWPLSYVLVTSRPLFLLPSREVALRWGREDCVFISPVLPASRSSEHNHLEILQDNLGQAVHRTEGLSSILPACGFAGLL